MTYKDLISTLVTEIREQRAWPGNATGSKLDDQLRLCYGATLVASDSLPLHQFSSSQTSSSLSSGSENSYLKFTFPADLFVTRKDLGIINVSIDGTPYQLEEAITHLYDFKEAVSSRFQQGETFVHVDVNERIIRSNGQTCTLKYVPLFTEPTSGNYTALDFPLPKPYDQQVIELVALHVESALNGNGNKSAVHNALAKLYGESYA